MVRPRRPLCILNIFLVHMATDFGRFSNFPSKFRNSWHHPYSTSIQCILPRQFVCISQDKQSNLKWVDSRGNFLPVHKIHVRDKLEQMVFPKGVLVLWPKVFKRVKKYRKIAKVAPIDSNFVKKTLS